MSHRTRCDRARVGNGAWARAWPHHQNELDMRIGRTLAPAAAPIGWGALWGAAAGILSKHDPTPRLAEEILRVFGVERTWLVSSGTAGLTLALLALKSRRPGTDVIIPAYTCFSVPAAVLRAGLRPVPCDIDPA